MSNKSNQDENARIGHLLKSAREARRVSQAEIAQATGMSKNHISAIERGISKASVELLLGYCCKLDMTPNELLGLSGNEILPNLQNALAKMSHAEQVKVLALIKLMQS